MYGYHRSQKVASEVGKIITSNYFQFAQRFLFRSYIEVKYCVASFKLSYIEEYIMQEYQDNLSLLIVLEKGTSKTSCSALVRTCSILHHSRTTFFRRLLISVKLLKNRFFNLWPWILQNLTFSKLSLLWTLFSLSSCSEFKKVVSSTCGVMRAHD